MTIAVIPPKYELQSIYSIVQRGEINLHALIELTKNIPDEGENRSELAELGVLLSSLSNQKGPCQHTFVVTRTLLDALRAPKNHAKQVFTVDSIKELPDRAHTIAVRIKETLQTHTPKELFMTPQVHRQALTCAEELRLQFHHLMSLFDDVERYSQRDANTLISRADRDTIIKRVSEAAKHVREVQTWIRRVYINRSSKEFLNLYVPDAPRIIEDVLVMLDSLGPDRTVDHNRHFIRIDGVIMRIEAFKAYMDMIQTAAAKLGEDFTQKPHPELAPVIHKVHEALPRQQSILLSAHEAFSDAYEILRKQYVSPRGEMHKRLKMHQDAIDKKPPKKNIFQRLRAKLGF